MLRKGFPSGNFLLHTAGVKEAMLIIESGMILSSVEVAKRMGERWGRGGGFGISFNLNDVRVLNGDNKHFIGFLTDPDLILDKNIKLTLPEYAANFEMQLVPNSYDRRKRIWRLGASSSLGTLS